MIKLLNSNGTSESFLPWKILFRDSKGDENIAFAIAFRCPRQFDFDAVARGVPEGIVLCSPDAIAGIEHLKGVSFQASESWARGIRIARDKSIELLMRITCQSQISESVKISKTSKTSSIALFGVVRNDKAIHEAIEKVKVEVGNPVNDPSLLDLDEKKMSVLLRIQELPERADSREVVSFLIEKAALLAFAK